MSQWVLAALVAVFPILVVFAAASDFFTMTISNRLSAGLFVAGLAALAITQPGWPALGAHLGAAFLVFAIGFFCFARGWMGGGDVKFAAAVALWLGWSNLLDFALGFSLIGGVLTFAVLTADRLLTPVPNLKVGFLARFHEHRRVPYGIALSAAALLIFPETGWISALLIG